MRKRKVKKVIRKNKITKKTKKKKSTITLSKGFYKTHWKYCIVIVLACLAIYLKTWNYEYVLDDQIVITDNNYTKQGISGIWKLLSTESFEGYFGEQRDLVTGARYRPLSLVTFAIEYEIFGLSPVVSHLNNILIYILLCLLLFRIYHDLFRDYKTDFKFLSFGFIVALIYTVHPLHTEVVANIKGRDEIMSFLFALTSLYSFIKALDSKKWIYYVLTSIVFFLGLLAKESTITFLAIIPLTLYFFSKHSLKNILLSSVSILLPTVVYLIIRYHVVGYLLDSGKEITDLMNNPFVYMNISEKYATIFYTLGIYLKLGFFPHPLTHDYYPFHIPAVPMFDLRSIIPVVLYTGLIILALLGLRKKSLISYSILFFMASLSIASNLLFPVGTFMNERFLFTPGLGFCIVLGYLFSIYLPAKLKGKLKFASLIFLSLITMAYASRSFTRVSVWKNALTLNTAAIKVSKNSARANTFMATALYNKLLAEADPNEKKRMLDQADFYSAKALELYPTYSSANIMRSGIVAEQYKYHGDIDLLLAEFKKIAIVRPALDYLHQYYKYLNERRSNIDQLINFYYDVGYNELHLKSGQNEWAIRYLKYAEELDQYNIKILSALSNVYGSLGNLDESQNYAQRVRELRSR